jgi:hypothetical protein
VAEFRGLPDSQIRIIIGWAELVFTDKTVAVRCELEELSGARRQATAVGR